MSPDHAHLDAEMLAAWMDGGLDASATAQAEAHVSNCERCQAMVATFVRTEAPGTVPLAHGTPAPGTRSLWRWWLAPLVATAAAVTIWMVMPPQTTQPVGTSEPAVAERKADARAAPAAPPAERPSRAAEETKPTLADNSASARASSSELRRDRISQDQDQARNQAAGAPDRVAKLEAAPRSADSAFSKPSEARAESPPPAPLAETVAVAPAAPPPAPATMPLPAVQRRVGPFEIVSPSPAFRWRIDTRGSIERSEDGGQSWFPIRLGAGETIAAGSSPSRNICWVVGRGGLVLIAVDGVSFVRLPFPHELDLVAIAATDGRMATITAADGRTFTTTDSGRTWK